MCLAFLYTCIDTSDGVFRRRKATTRSHTNVHASSQHTHTFNSSLPFDRTGRFRSEIQGETGNTFKCEHRGTKFSYKCIGKLRWASRHCSLGVNGSQDDEL